eukprot:Tamp_09039.p1 GENE.Tamp_09039~~Tamp_09039.p1  ORF type:complete len:503 (+),score=69.24 Tamp_09039:91-1509(+)
MRLQRSAISPLRGSRVRTGSLRLQASSPAVPDPQESKLVLKGETPLASCVTNLVKNIVGSGVLCLAGSVAAFSDNALMLVPALGIAAFFAIVAGYCFVLIARTCQMTGAVSYSDAWAKTLGQSTAWIPTLIVVFKTWSACLIYSIIIADLTVDLCATAGVKSLIVGGAEFVLSRTNIILATHIFGLLPLCLLRSFTILSYAAFLGIGGILFVAAFMSLRWVEGSYAAGGAFFAAIMKAEGKKHVISSFNVAGTSLLKSLVLVSTLTSSYLCHYNSPKFLTELKDATVKRFEMLTYSSFSIAFALNAVFMVTGFLTFGGMSQGLILNNYATSDTLATASRGAIAASILLGFPITFEGFRTAFLELINNKKPDQKTKDLIAVGFLIACGGSAMVLSDLGAVVSFFGALLGSAVIYVIPGMMFRRARKAELAASGSSAPLGLDYTIAGGLIPMGTFLALLGAAVVVLKATTNILK